MYVRGSDKNIEYKRDLNGFFRGIIMDDADFKKLYRCKIFVPEIHTIPYTKVKGKQQYTAPDKIGSLPPDVHKSLLDMLPWAEQASSLFGEQSSSVYSAKLGMQTGGVNYPQESRRTNQPNAQVMGTSPAETFANATATGGLITDGNVSNPTGNIYAPAPNAPMARGIHGTPSVGAHVWVFFDRGDINCPVYFAACPSGLETNQVMRDRNVTGFSSAYPNEGEVDDTPPEPKTDLPTQGSSIGESTAGGPQVSRRTNLDNLNPNEKQLLLELAAWEVGSLSPDAKIAWMETVANRAAASNRSVTSLVSSGKNSQRGYYRDFWNAKNSNSIPRGRSLNESNINEYNSYFNTVANGSNITWGATDNASDDGRGNNLKTRIKNGLGPSGRDANPGSFVEIDGELYYSKKQYRRFLNNNGFNPDDAGDLSRRSNTGMLPPTIES
jgi:hypothetical protein